MITNFGEQLKQFAKSTDARVNAVVKKIVIDIGVKLVLRSPVGDPKYWKSPPPPGYVGGRFRANWQYSLDSIDTTTTMTIDKVGAPTISRITGEIPGEAIGHAHYITNSLPYALRLEEGWSRQAPGSAAIVGITALEFEPIVREAVAELTT